MLFICPSSQKTRFLQCKAQLANNVKMQFHILYIQVWLQQQRYFFFFFFEHLTSEILGGTVLGICPFLRNLLNASIPLTKVYSSLFFKSQMEIGIFSQIRIRLNQTLTIFSFKCSEKLLVLPKLLLFSNFHFCQRSKNISVTEKLFCIRKIQKFRTSEGLPPLPSGPQSPLFRVCL